MLRSTAAASTSTWRLSSRLGAALTIASLTGKLRYRCVQEPYASERLRRPCRLRRLPIGKPALMKGKWPAQ